MDFLRGGTESTQWKTGERVVTPPNSILSWSHNDSGDRGARNVLTWNELDGSGNLIKCEKITVFGGYFAGRTLHR